MKKMREGIADPHLFHRMGICMKTPACAKETQKENSGGSGSGHSPRAGRRRPRNSARVHNGDGKGKLWRKRERAQTACQPLPPEANA